MATQVRGRVRRRRSEPATSRGAQPAARSSQPKATRDLGALAVYAVPSDPVGAALGYQFVDPVVPTWRAKRLVKLELHAQPKSASRGTAEVKRVEQLIALLPSVPSIADLETLAIGQQTAGANEDFRLVIKALAKVVTTMPSLRHLEIGSYKDASFDRLGDISALWDVVGSFESLSITARSADLGRIVAPGLRTFVLRANGFKAVALESITAAVWPALERLSLDLGAPARNSDGCLPEQIERLLAGQRTLPRLRHLRLATGYADEIAASLASSPLLPQLRSLDLSGSELGTDGIRAFVARAKRFAHLEELDVSTCRLDREGVRLAKTLAKHVLADDEIRRQASRSKY